MTIGSKKFKQLEEKLIEAGFADELKSTWENLKHRKSDAKSKLNLSRIAATLDIKYHHFRNMMNKGPRMTQEYYELINNKLQNN